ncbi:hypothetical protein ColTof4_11818 [Colletotrichum tofieldiae]|nr:hypothetical protein ColTof3_03107 [Colletotrichum tofieldiae]GKT79395.1 hypothetical protein ColTof4_11818 [Colletotrichum tofieldiae]
MFAGEGDGYALSRVSPRGQDEPTPPLNCSAAYDGHNPPKTARAGNVSGPLDTDALDIPPFSMGAQEAASSEDRPFDGQ